MEVMYEAPAVIDLKSNRIGEGNEKHFFCLWNQLMLEKGYIANIGRIHMNSVLIHFVEEMGRQVVEGNLYRQLVIHLVQMERETVISNSQLVNLVRKLQQV